VFLSLLMRGLSRDHQRQKEEKNKSGSLFQSKLLKNFTLRLSERTYVRC
jgi:hypothetical protein